MGRESLRVLSFKCNIPLPPRRNTWEMAFNVTATLDCVISENYYLQV